MRIAIAIPTYNKAGMIEAAIDSVLNQKAPPFDIYVFDDASSDATNDIVRRRYESKLIHIQNAKNLGYV